MYFFSSFLVSGLLLLAFLGPANKRKEKERGKEREDRRDTLELEARAKRASLPQEGSSEPGKPDFLAVFFFLPTAGFFL